MPCEDETKERAFRLWALGKRLWEIQETISGGSGESALSIEEWVKDWERGSQAVWDPVFSGDPCGRLGRTPLLRELLGAVEQFSNHYILWLIAARIARWTHDPEELQQTRDMMEKGLESLERIVGFLQRNRGEFPQQAQGALSDLLEMAQVENVHPTAQFFQEKTNRMNQITDRLRNAIRVAGT